MKIIEKFQITIIKENHGRESIINIFDSSNILIGKISKTQKFPHEDFKKHGDYKIFMNNRDFKFKFVTSENIFYKNSIREFILELLEMFFNKLKLKYKIKEEKIEIDEKKLK